MVCRTSRAVQTASARAAVALNRGIVDALYPNVVARVGRVDDVAAADVHRHVRNVAVIEDEVARLELAAGDVRDRAVLPGRVVWQGNSGALPGCAGQARAVIRTGSVRAPLIGLAHLGVRERDGP